MPQHKPNYSDIAPYLSLLFRLGFKVCGSILIWFFIGFFIDKILHTKGLALVVCIIIGILSGLYFIYKDVMSLDEQSTK